MRSKFFSFWGSVSAFLLITILFNSCVKDVTKRNVIYQNNFEDSNISFIKIYGYGVNGPIVGGTWFDNFNGSKVLGRFNNNAMELPLSSLPPHDAISIELDLYIHDLWKNDLWKYTFDGADRFLTCFSNDSSVLQSYPNTSGNPGVNPPGSDAFTTHLPRACRLISSSHGTSMYKIAVMFLHSAKNFTFACSDAGTFVYSPCDRSWSMDNLKITLITFN